MNSSYVSNRTFYLMGVFRLFSIRNIVVHPSLRFVLILFFFIVSLKCRKGFMVSTKAYYLKKKHKKIQTGSFKVEIHVWTSFNRE